MAKLGRPLAMSVEDRRKEIFMAAEQLFGQKGFEQVTMADIAACAGMSKKTLYVYFSDKKELLKSLVSSSYIWPDHAFHIQNLSPKEALKQQLKLIAEHVLSERHIRLCRLAITEGVAADAFNQTFYDMGIAKSRNHLVAAVHAIDTQDYVLKLDAEILSDTLFGASIAKPFIDLLLTAQKIDLVRVFQNIELTVNEMFITR